jgi:anti-sigma factor RsiW
MHCKHARSRLPDFADGALRPVEHDAIAAHLAACPACAAELAALRAFDAFCEEHLVVPEAAYTEADLLARMDAVEPVEAIPEYVPTVRVAQHAPRLAAAVAVTVCASVVPAQARAGRGGEATPRHTLESHVARLEHYVEESLDPRGPASPGAPSAEA